MFSVDNGCVVLESSLHQIIQHLADGPGDRFDHGCPLIRHGRYHLEEIAQVVGGDLETECGTGGRQHAPLAQPSDSLFWALRHHWPRETREFVPKLVGAIIVIAVFAWGVTGYVNATTSPGDALEIQVLGKKWLWESGLRVPLIVRWPSRIVHARGHTSHCRRPSSTSCPISISSSIASATR